MLKVVNVKDFDAFFYLLETSFPTDEYRIYEMQKNLFNNPLYNPLGYFIKDKLIALVALWEFDDFIFIEHFAVDADFRNNGIGTLVLKELNVRYSKKLCLEVELPNNDLASRRILFYKRNGFYLNEYPYIQPSMGKGRNPIPLMIMTSGEYIAVDEFEVIKNTLYKYVYNV